MTDRQTGSIRKENVKIGRSKSSSSVHVHSVLKEKVTMSSAKPKTFYHINPELGPMKCSATVGKCRYHLSKEEHFTDFDEARKSYESQLSQEINPLISLSRKDIDSTFSEKNFSGFEATCETLDFEELAAFANASKSNYEKMMKLVNTRAELSPQRAAKLAFLDPKGKGVDKLVTHKTFNAMKREWNNYRNQTAQILEAAMSSKYYHRAALDWELDHVGNAQEMTTYAQDDPRWYSSRYDTVGGSDVGAIVMSDFMDRNSLESLEKLYISKVEKSKRVVTVPKALADPESNPVTERSRANAAYRGTVWEEKIADDFAKDHPEMKVFNSKKQFAPVDRPWQRVNFDGIVASDGKNPDAVLEIKTGSDPREWENNTIPLKYKVQTLYYLNATGFDKAYIRCLINDGQVVDRVVHKNDEVYPGSGITMDEYVEKRIPAWLEEQKKHRMEVNVEEKELLVV